jgi:hypothetical protein
MAARLFAALALCVLWEQKFILQQDPFTPEFIVKFSIAPSFLFAVLLRSPLWISFAIATVISLIMLALLPMQYAVVGACGSMAEQHLFDL